MSLHIEERDGAVSFELLVVPRASRAAVGPVVGDRLKVAVTAPPVEGKANEAIVALLAKELGLRRRDVEIVAGQQGRRKRVVVRGISAATLLERWT